MEFIKDNKKGIIYTQNNEKLITFQKDRFKRDINNDMTTTAKKSS